MPHSPLPYKITRNPSWLASVRLTFTAVIWDAPSSFVRTMVVPVLHFLGYTGLLISTLCAWVFTRLFLIAAGLCGYLSEPKAETEEKSCPRV